MLISHFCVRSLIQVSTRAKIKVCAGLCLPLETLEWERFPWPFKRGTEFGSLWSQNLNPCVLDGCQVMTVSSFQRWPTPWLLSSFLHPPSWKPATLRSVSLILQISLSSPPAPSTLISHTPRKKTVLGTQVIRISQPKQSRILSSSWSHNLNYICKVPFTL